MLANLIIKFLQTARSIRIAAPHLLAISLVGSAQAVASDNFGRWSVDINGVSKHSENRYFEDGQSRKYNETNMGLGGSVEWLGWNRLVRQSPWTQWIAEARIDVDIKAGFFDNSYDETSFYAGPFFHRDMGTEDWKFAPGLAVLMVTGYDDTPEDAPPIFPLPVFSLEFGHKALKFNLGYIPWGEVDLFTLQLQIIPDHYHW